MAGFRIFRRINAHKGMAELSAGFHYSDGYLTPVGYQDLMRALFHTTLVSF
jgi:hypothetical protein